MLEAVNSVIVAAGSEPKICGIPGCPCAVNTEGAMPNVQLSIVPVHKSLGISYLVSAICLGT